MQDANKTINTKVGLDLQGFIQALLLNPVLETKIQFLSRTNVALWEGGGGARGKVPERFCYFSILEALNG